MLNIRDERQLRALTGVSEKQFDKLLEKFTQVYEARQQAAYEAGIAQGTRQRKPGGGGERQAPHLSRQTAVCLVLLQSLPNL